MKPSVYLPCLRWSKDRWWLPLESTTADLLASLLMGQSAVSLGSRQVALLEARLQTDPALLIFVALRRLEHQRRRGADRRPADVVTISKLARWFGKHLASILSSPDGMLGAPEVTAKDQQAWTELAAGCHTLPVADWLNTAPHWLGVKGSRVPTTWMARWPRVRNSECRSPNESAAADSPNTSDTPARCEIPLRYATGTLSLTKLAGLVRSQSHLQHAFDQRLQAEKLAALKQFAYGLTHEINNPLANIVTRSEQLMAGEADPQRLASHQRIIDQAMRAHEMISDVMYYAHPPRPEKMHFDWADVVNEVISEYQSAFGAQSIDIQSIDIQCRTNEPLDVFADRGMLRDALAALLRNAVEAVGSSGKIVVSTSLRNQRAMVSVSDSGPGLSEEARRHAFDPYYSGREAGRGLGLGLCRVYRIAKLHRGGAAISGAIAGCVARFWFTTK